VSDTGGARPPRWNGSEPFFTTAARQGTGLGLSVQVVRSHDGAISVSGTPGQGTCFQLYFPAQAGAVTAAPEAAVASRPGHGQRILFLDDEEPMVFLAQRMLSRLGYQVTGYTRPAEALQAFRANPDQFDLVTDMNMPGLSDCTSPTSCSGKRCGRVLSQPRDR
jgi:hypothetical protein